MSRFKTLTDGAPRSTPGPRRRRTLLLASALAGGLAVPAGLALAVDGFSGAAHAQNQNQSQNQNQNRAASPFNMGMERQTLDPAARAAIGERDAERQRSAMADAPAADPRLKRYLVERSTPPVLQGELASERFTLNLSAEQAESPATLQYGYQNAVVIAPESSTLTVTVNGRQVGEEAIASANTVTRSTIDLPADLLVEGRNTVTFTARQRHRTDCTIASTYELITEINPATTFLSFDRDVSGDRLALDDLAILGAGLNGSREVRVVAPVAARADISSDLVELAQAIALASDIEAPVFTLVTDPNTARPDAMDNGMNGGMNGGMDDGAAMEGVSDMEGQPALTVYLGTGDDIEGLIGTLPEEARSQASYAGFVGAADGMDGQGQVLVLTGSSEGGWRSAITRLAQLSTVSATGANGSGSGNGIGEDPGYGGATNRYTFAELGLDTIQFAGRRFETSFSYDMPYDIYANAYGEAQILLDAAYSDTIEAGSQLNVLVNGQVANSLNFSGRGGGIFEHEELDVPMRHFKPGANEITLAVNLVADEDELCAPGATATAQPRLAIFDSSEFTVDSFARVDRRPNLAALSAAAHPYATGSGNDDDGDDGNDGTGASAGSVDIVIMRGRSAPNDAAMTLVGRLARAAGGALDITVSGLNEPPTSDDTIVIGPISSLPEALLDAVGIADTGSWRAPTGSGSDTPRAMAADGEAEAPRTLAEWGDSVADGEAGDWLSDTFDLSLPSFGLTGTIVDYRPDGDDTLILAQTPTPDGFAGEGDGRGALTVVTAPDARELARSMAAFVEPDNWTRAGGRLTAFSRTEQSVETIEPVNAQFIATQPLSLNNTRLIATNWLSANVVTYVVVLFLFCIALGLITYAMLSAFGRRNDDA